MNDSHSTSAFASPICTEADLAHATGQARRIAAILWGDHNADRIAVDWAENVTGSTLDLAELDAAARHVLLGEKGPDLSNPTTAALVLVDSILAGWRERIIEPMLDYGADGLDPITPARMLAQLLMEDLLDLDGLSSPHKMMLCQMADHMGPDWAQGLYRAAVFATKVA